MNISKRTHQTAGSEDPIAHLLNMEASYLNLQNMPQDIVQAITQMFKSNPGAYGDNFLKLIEKDNLVNILAASYNKNNPKEMDQIATYLKVKMQMLHTYAEKVSSDKSQKIVDYLKALPFAKWYMDSPKPKYGIVKFMNWELNYLTMLHKKQDLELSIDIDNIDRLISSHGTMVGSSDLGEQYTKGITKTVTAMYKMNPDMFPSILLKLIEEEHLLKIYHDMLSIRREGSWDGIPATIYMHTKLTLLKKYVLKNTNRVGDNKLIIMKIVDHLHMFAMDHPDDHLSDSLIKVSLKLDEYTVAKSILDGLDKNGKLYQKIDPRYLKLISEKAEPIKKNE